jgi:hypothetical protein
MKSQCSKCLSEVPADYVVKYRILPDPVVQLCLNCNSTFDNRAEMLQEFLKDDYGTFPIGKISRDMIEARKKRALGQSPWQKKEQVDEEKKES